MVSVNELEQAKILSYLAYLLVSKFIRVSELEQMKIIPYPACLSDPLSWNRPKFYPISSRALISPWARTGEDTILSIAFTSQWTSTGEGPILSRVFITASNWEQFTILSYFP